MRLNEYWKVKEEKDTVAKQNALEKRVTDLESSQEVQNQAIDELVEQSMEDK